jgi:hypothetical protein
MNIKKWSQRGNHDSNEYSTYQYAGKHDIKRWILLTGSINSRQNVSMKNPTTISYLDKCNG